MAQKLVMRCKRTSLIDAKRQPSSSEDMQYAKCRDMYARVLSQMERLDGYRIPASRELGVEVGGSGDE